MPLMVGMRGWKSDCKGETVDKKFWDPGFFARLFGRRHRMLTTTAGHEILCRLSDVVCVEAIPQSEIDTKENAEKEKRAADEEAQRKAAEEAATASHCRKCGLHSPRHFDFCPKCGSALVKKEPPKPAIPQGN